MKIDWCNKNDNTAPVISAKAHINSAHAKHGGMGRLPKTALLFYMHGWLDYVKSIGGRLIMRKLPRFLSGCEVYELDDDICCMDGGRGAPQAADTVETLCALGVERIVTVGMFGAFDESVEQGETIVVDKAFVEEGTSLHYYNEIEFSKPDEKLKTELIRLVGAKPHTVVSTDAVYRQTYYKEKLWREKGAVGVDMETSAVLSVAAYVGVRAAALLTASDMHPQKEGEESWEWKMTDEMRKEIFHKAINAVKVIADEE